MAAKSKVTGKRYTPEEKQEVIDFINAHNASQGRGGASAASKKFGTSPITISSWLKKGSGKASENGSATKPAGKRGRKPGSKNAVKSTSRSEQGSRSATLQQLATLDQQIGKQRAELEALERQFQSLKSNI